MTRYERITTVDHEGRRCTRILVDPVDGRMVTGFEVDRFGARLDRLHVIDPVTITKRTPMRMDLHYARLVTER